MFELLFFLVFVPFVLMNFQNVRKAQKETNDLLRETNTLLSKIAGQSEKG